MYILFEGIDGVGKSTQIELVSKIYNDFVYIKEPGQTNFGENLRDILLSGKFNLSKRAEILLFLADRAETADKVLKKNIDKTIISDRGFISGISYALANDDFNLDELIWLNKFALNGILPDKIVFFKADENLISERFKSRGYEDMIEKRGIEYLLKVQDIMQKTIKYLNLNSITIDASLPANEIMDKILNFINQKGLK